MNRFSRLVAIGLAPVLLVQGRRLRRTIPRLPDAALPWTGSHPGDDPIRLLVLGDSTATGVGASTQDEALPGNLARLFADRYGRGTEWVAEGRNGATARDLLTDHLRPELAEFDVVFLTVGANDALALRSRGAFRRDVVALVRQLRAGSQQALILVSLMPRFDRFTSLRNPVRWNLALHAASLDDAAREALSGEPGVITLPKPPPYAPSFWASDGFHPSAAGYRDWVDFVSEAADRRVLDTHLGG